MEVKDQVTQSGIDKITLFNNLTDAVERCEKQLNGAIKELQEAEFDLVRWMLPPDAQPGEVFQLAIGDSYLVVENGTIQKPSKVFWRNGRRPTKQ